MGPEISLAYFAESLTVSPFELIVFVRRVVDRQVSLLSVVI
jgi:hypothetical protein